MKTSYLWALASDHDRLGRFLEVIGIRADQNDRVANEPCFLSGVLDYVMTDDTLLTECAVAIGERPERISQAHSVLSPEIAWT